MTARESDYFPRFLQDLQYGSREWHLAYSTPRNTIESQNSRKKDGRLVDWAAKGRRRMRGFAAVCWWAALAVVAQNLMDIERMRYEEPEVDERGRGAEKPRRVRRRDKLRLSRYRSGSSPPASPAVPV